MYFDSDNRRNNNKTMAELERQQERLVRIYNSVFHAISDMKSSKDYLSTRNLLNVFSSEEGVNTFDIYKLRKMLDSKVVELLEENEKQMQNIQKDIDNIKSIKVEESTEQLKELDLRSNNILYKYMSLLHMNGIQENSDRRLLGESTNTRRSSCTSKALRLTSILWTVHRETESCYCRERKESGCCEA